MPESPARQSAADHLIQLLQQCVEREASDLHLVPDHAPYWRIHGRLAPHDGEATVSVHQMEALADVLLADVDRGRLDRVGDQDGATSGADGTRFRYNIYRRQGQLSIALRRLEDEFQTLAQLGLPDSLYELSGYADGLVVLAGPTGAGKSTTLATLLHRINQTRQCHIVTIEDPIEYLHRPIRSLINQRQIGSDARSFADALVASLRQDPDVILVGEVRDLDTIRIALNAAETGHLVFTTVHAGDCVGAIERLVSVFPADEQDGVRRQLSLVLRAIVSQHLLVTDDSKASATGPASAERATASRVVASEILRSTPAVANLIAVGKSAQIYSSMETGSGVGMQTLEQDLARLLADGAITEAAALAVARHPAVVRERVARLRATPARAHSTGGKR